MENLIQQPQQNVQQVQPQQNTVNSQENNSKIDIDSIKKEIVEAIKNDKVQDVEKFLNKYKESIVAEAYSTINSQYQNKIKKIEEFEKELEWVKQEKQKKEEEARRLEEENKTKEEEKKTLSQKYEDINKKLSDLEKNIQSKIEEQKKIINLQKLELTKKDLLMQKPLHPNLIPDLDPNDTEETYKQKYEKAFNTYKEIEENFRKNYKPQGAIIPKGDEHIVQNKENIDFSKLTKEDLEKLKDEMFKNFGR